jgi:hypothetical protein
MDAGNRERPVCRSYALSHCILYLYSNMTRKTLKRWVRSATPYIILRPQLWWLVLPVFGMIEGKKYRRPRMDDGVYNIRNVIEWTRLTDQAERYIAMQGGDVIEEHTHPNPEKPCSEEFTILRCDFPKDCLAKVGSVGCLQAESIPLHVGKKLTATLGMPHGFVNKGKKGKGWLVFRIIVTNPDPDNIKPFKPARNEVPIVT